MKEVISKISKGIFEYESPIIELSVSRIEISMEMGTVYSGSFEIYSTNGMEIRGIVYSSNDNFVLLNNQFIGLHNTMHYRFHAENIINTDKIEGYLTFVCNGSEFELPFYVQINARVFHTEIGQIDTLKTFVNYVQNNYDEAVPLFCSDDFRNILLSEEPSYLSLYNGLIKGANKQIALEEFLIGIQKKEKITITLEENQKYYEDLDTPYGERFIILKDNWGYVAIDVEYKGDFLLLEKNKIFSDEFVGNQFALDYLIVPDQLHKGNNFGCIILKTNNQRLEYFITVKQNMSFDSARLQRKIDISDTIKNYLKFRMHQLSMDKWIEDSLMILEKGSTQNSILFMLLKAQIKIIQQQCEEAETLLNKAGQDLICCKKEDKDLYCFYLYLKTLQKQDVKYTREISIKVNEYYHNGYDNFVLFWILLHTDEQFITNKRLRFSAIRKQFQKSCNSPLLYFEAINIINEFPDYLRTIDDFSIQVLLFGAKNNYISTKLARQIADLAILEKECSPLLFKVLQHLYEVYQDKQILEAICSLLIRSNRFGTGYFKWFALGVQCDLKITKLFDYYMYSIDTKQIDVLPQNILMYYLYNANSLLEKQAYLYYNIIRNKEKNMKMYHSYRNHIQKYAMAEIKKGSIDEFRAVIYEEVIDKSNFDIDVLNKLPELFHTYKLECNNKNIIMAWICNDELTIQHPVKLYQGKSYVMIGTSDFNIVFEDVFGNRYFKTIDFSLKRIFEEEKYTNICLEQNPNNEILIATHIEEVLKSSKNHRKTLSLILDLTNKDIYRVEYVKNLMSKVIEYYSINYEEELLDEYLPLFDYEKMNHATRAKAMELLIMRDKFEEVTPLFVKYKDMGVNPKNIVKFCTRMLEEYGEQQEPIIMHLCYYAFKCGLYNDAILQYLSTNYYGSTKEMYAIWEALKNFDCENRELEEKLLVQMIFTKAYSSKRNAIFCSYYEKGVKQDLAHAYYNFESYEYYVMENMIPDTVFPYIENELQKNNYLNTICKFAYLKYCSESEQLKENQITLCKELVYQFSNQNIRLNCFKNFNKFFKLPYQVKDKLNVEFKANPKNRVFINYILETGQLEKQPYITEEMKSIYPGIFEKEFILFYGEKILYYITEESMNGKNYTQSMSLSLLDEEIYTEDNRYGALNNMMISMDVNDEATLQDIALQYAVNRFLTDTIFEIM